MFREFNDGGSNKACRNTVKMELRKKSKHFKWFMLGRVSFSWDTMFWEFNDGGTKKAYRNTVKMELRKKVETCLKVYVRTG
jgi:hypothetical protein